MPSEMLDIEALDKLIKAVADYQESLETNKKILLNAANACEAAMGKEEISKKKVGKLRSALAELEKVTKYVKSVAEALKDDKERAIRVVEDMY